MRKSIKVFLVIILALPFCLSAQQRADKTFTGSENSNWSNPNNWDPPGVPTLNDDVYIPPSAPVCHIDNPDGGSPAFANSIFNAGNIQLDNSSWVVVDNDFENHAYINVVNDGIGFGARINGTYFTSKFKNVGFSSVTGEEGTSLYFQNFEDVDNHGSITGENISISSINFFNAESSVVFPTKNLNITASNEIYNNGELIAGSHTDGMTFYSMKLKTETLVNNNKIFTENKHGNYPAADIWISADKLENNKNIMPGWSYNTNLNGILYNNSKVTNNYGRMTSGSSINKSVTRDETYFNNVYHYCDTLILSGDSCYSEADTLNIFFNYLKIEDISQYAAIWGDIDINFHGTENAVADLSTGNTGGAVSIGYGNINFYCNNIIAPPEGLGYVCVPTPNVYEADTTITGAYVEDGSFLITEGTSGTKKIAFQNQSTASKIFDYEIYSDKGWVTAQSSQTSLTMPLYYDSVDMQYTLPEDAGIEPDTVHVILKKDEVSLAESEIVIFPEEEIMVDINNLSCEFDELLKVYPNPFKNELNFITSTNINASLISSYGKVIHKFSLQSGDVYTWKPSSDLNYGAYIIRIETRNGLTSSKTVIYMPE